MVHAEPRPDFATRRLLLARAAAVRGGTVLAGWLNVLALALIGSAAWESGERLIAALAGAGLAGVGAAALFIFRWRARGSALGKRPAVLRPTGRLAVLGGIAWAAFLVLAGRAGADAPELAMAVRLGGLAVLFSSLGLYRAVPLATTAQLLLVGCGAAAGALLSLGQLAPVVLLAPLAGGALWIHLRARDRAFAARLRKDTGNLAENHDLHELLGEYEALASDWLWATAPDGTLRDVSLRFGDAVRRSPHQLHGMPLADLFDDGPAAAALATALVHGEPFRDRTLRLQIAGQPRFWSVSGRRAAGGGMRGVMRDVTETRAAQARVAHMAHHDALTGLANRNLFGETLSAALTQAAQDGRQVALFCLDLDNFKVVNDSGGHGAGDALLRELAARLTHDVRATDLVARLGGDEFAILMQTDAGDATLIERAHRFLSLVREPFNIDGATFGVTVSIGVARGGLELADPEELLRRADLALYAAKAKGRDSVAVFAPRLEEEARLRRTLEAELRDAIAADQFELHYQPVVALEDSRISGVEALLRWRHPTRGLLCPDAFLAVAESAGLIVPLGEWVIHRALAEFSSLPGALRLAVNLSPTQVRSARLVPVVSDALQASGVAAERVEFEITEHVALDDSEASRAALMRLRELRLGVALDDFGTGYSSLNYLRCFPFDRIKIDRTFVSGLQSDPTARAVVATVIGLARTLGMETLAEGVETPEQAHVLAELGCSEAQGFLFHRPMPIEALAQLVGGGAGTAPAGPRRTRRVQPLANEATPG